MNTFGFPINNCCNAQFVNPCKPNKDPCEESEDPCDAVTKPCPKSKKSESSEWSNLYGDKGKKRSRSKKCKKQDCSPTPCGQDGKFANSGCGSTWNNISCTPVLPPTFPGIGLITPQIISTPTSDITSVTIPSTATRVQFTLVGGGGGSLATTGATGSTVNTTTGFGGGGAESILRIELHNVAGQTFTLTPGAGGAPGANGTASTVTGITNSGLGVSLNAAGGLAGTATAGGNGGGTGGGIGATDTSPAGNGTTVETAGTVRVGGGGGGYLLVTGTSTITRFLPGGAAGAQGGSTMPTIGGSSALASSYGYGVGGSLGGGVGTTLTTPQPGGSGAIFVYY